MLLPADFLDQMRTLLATEFSDFINHLEKEAPVSLHLHPFKKYTPDLPATPVLWQPLTGRYLEQRSVFTLDPAFHGGAYYVQEASSMFVAAAVRQTLDLSKNLRVLDLCAAPGGKSTLIAGLLNEKSWILSNEVIQSRYQVLKENLVKWGLPNMLASNHDPEDFAPLRAFFDLVLVDAPCSGEGLFRKDAQAAGEWSKENVQLCAGRQKRILAAAVPLLKLGGVLLYATCTFNDFENGENCTWLLQNFDLEEVVLNFNADWGIVRKKHGLQFYPHKVRGEGFFIAAFRKKAGASAPEFSKRKSNGFLKMTPLGKKENEWMSGWFEVPDAFEFYRTTEGQVRALPGAILTDLLLLDGVLKRKQFGVEAGEFKGDSFIPAHELALSTIIKKDLPAIDLNKEQALVFLKKEIPQLPAGRPQGWALARYKGLNLGWLKILPNRANNYLPASWRIRMQLPK